MGSCGVPYVLLDRTKKTSAHCVQGELWRVSTEALAGLDDYEGITKGYYGRTDILCRTTPAAPTAKQRSPVVLPAQIYGVVATEHFGMTNNCSRCSACQSTR